MRRLLFLAAIGIGIVSALQRINEARSQRAWPCWRGHDDSLLSFGDGEIFLRCSRCLKRTAGWQLGDKVMR